MRLLCFQGGRQLAVGRWKVERIHADADAGPVVDDQDVGVYGWRFGEVGVWARCVLGVCLWS